MTAMRLALAMGRIDVDAMLDEVDHDQFIEWAAFFSVEPHGWNAINLAQARISTMIGLSVGAKKVKERNLLIKSTPASTPRNESLRYRAYAIRHRIRAEKLQLRKHGRKAN